MAGKINTELRELRAKAALYDELVEQLTVAEQELDRARRSATRDGVDPAWREIANALAGALRPYSLFSEQRVQDGRIVVETRVPGSTLRKASEALDRLARQVAVESYRARTTSRCARTRNVKQRRDGLVVGWPHPLRTADPAPILARLRRAAPGVQRPATGGPHL